MDWKFWVADIIIPIVALVVGFITGRVVERKASAKAKIKGNNNTIIQNSMRNSHIKTNEKDD